MISLSGAFYAVLMYAVDVKVRLKNLYTYPTCIIFSDLLSLILRSCYDRALLLLMCHHFELSYHAICRFSSGLDHGILFMVRPIV